jgi:hypothetical protein
MLAALSDCLNANTSGNHLPGMGGGLYDVTMGERKAAKEIIRKT